MSLVTESESSLVKGSQQSLPTTDDQQAKNVNAVVDRVRQIMAPVWPLADYVAVNPFAGVTHQKILEARRLMRTVSDVELLMPVDYYRKSYDAGRFTRSDINEAVDELVQDKVAGAERLDVGFVISHLLQPADDDSRGTKTESDHRQCWSLSEVFDRNGDSDWSGRIEDEISKHCSAHYDEGQSLWPSPYRDQPLVEAWRATLRHDRNFEVLGVSGFRSVVSRLPARPEIALASLLRALGVPSESWEPVLLCYALTLPGWSAWTTRQDEKRDPEQAHSDFLGLLVMRLCYDVALANHERFEVRWHMLGHIGLSMSSFKPTDDELIRLALLKASEVSYRKRTLGQLSLSQPSVTPSESSAGAPLETTRKLAQMVFCIDVRSERIRRRLEAASSDVETLGFAGFFGMPIEYVRMGEESGSGQVPFLADPLFKVYEEFDCDDDCEVDRAVVRQSLDNRKATRFLRSAWDAFQKSVTGCFSFVETTGLLYSLKLLGRSATITSQRDLELDGVAKSDRSNIGPGLRGLGQQGMSTSRQVELAENMLRGMGLVEDFARLVVICGHESRTENNPLKAALDCGACGGHSGEPNARFAAKLLNQTYVRQSLQRRGIEIPDDVWFVGAVHVTTSDEVRWFDVDQLPETHREDFEHLQNSVRSAGQQTLIERTRELGDATPKGLRRRCRDWSEVRPEWGLAGNAAFIIGPRSLTSHASLQGRAFLHNYDYRQDESLEVLEQIMTAPLVVAHSINMQYYASTVSPLQYSSGNKTVHNVVGQFGVLTGNGGDLKTGLPLQSLHDGTEYRHEPLRLVGVIAAPRKAVETILKKHSQLREQFKNGWCDLIVIDNEQTYRWTAQETWDALQFGERRETAMV